MLLLFRFHEEQTQMLKPPIRWVDRHWFFFCCGKITNIYGVWGVKLPTRWKCLLNWNMFQKINMVVSVIRIWNIYCLSSLKYEWSPQWGVTYLLLVSSNNCPRQQEYGASPQKNQICVSGVDPKYKRHLPKRAILLQEKLNKAVNLSRAESSK